MGMASGLRRRNVDATLLPSQPTKDPTWTTARWRRMQSPARGTSTWRRWSSKFLLIPLNDKEITSVNERNDGCGNAKLVGWC